MHWRQIAIRSETSNLKTMSTLTLSTLDDALHRKLVERAKLNHRSIEDEAICCLQEAIESGEEAINAIPSGAWNEIERSVCETIHDHGTPLTDADFQRYRDKVRGNSR
jgi:plasmid stability protein